MVLDAFKRGYGVKLDATQACAVRQWLGVQTPVLCKHAFSFATSDQR